MNISHTDANPSSYSQSIDAQLGRILEQNKNLILEKWEAQARSVIPAAKDKANPALINSLPKLIDTIIETLTSTSPIEKLKLEEKNLATDHGEERAHMGDYTIDQIILEYNLLRQVVFEVIDPEGDMTLKQAKMIWDSIFIAVRNAATRFSEIREAEKIRLHEALRDTHRLLHNKYSEQTVDLQDIETKFTSIIDSIEDYAIFTLNDKGIITSWNAGAERMNGYTTEEAIGQHFSKLYPSDSILQNEPQKNLDTAKTESRYRGEGMRLRKNGEEFMADVYIIPLWRKNKLTGYAKIAQDLTEHNQLIQSRDLFLSESKGLRVEQKMRESFVSTLAHDLRSPLTAAKMSAQLIMKNPQNTERLMPLTQKIVDNITRTDKMISNLLDANRISAGERIPLKLKDCNLNKIAQDVCDYLATVYDGRMKLQSDQEINGFWDEECLIRILDNLATNALKYGDASTQVTISLKKQDNRAIIKVHNFGKVIEECDQPKLFEPYHRMADEANSSHKGWGLGLTLVKGLVEAHFGSVKVESFPVKGTTFTVDLPMNSASH